MKTNDNQGGSLVTDISPELDEGALAAKKIQEEEELGLRNVEGWKKYLVPFIALTWSLFQLSLSGWLLLDSTYIRAIHLAGCCSIRLIFVQFT